MDHVVVYLMAEYDSLKWCILSCTDETGINGI